MAATYPADTFQEGVDLTIEASNQLAQVVRGDANTEVTVADGSTIPSIRKAQTDSMYFKEPELWTTGQTETDYLQLKKYIDPTTGKESWWFAKSALVSNPIAMGTSPFGDDNWTLYTPEDLFISDKAEYESVYQALKGKAAEAGYNLVRGSFEEGGTLTNTNDVLWYQSNGKYYNWYNGSAKTVVAGSTPANIGIDWIDQSDVTLRSDLNVVVKVFESVSDMDADASLVVGQKCRTLGYYAVGDGGGNDYIIVAADTGTDDGGSYIDLSGTGFQAKGLFGSVVNVKQFGAKGDGVTDDSGFINNAINFVYLSGLTLVISAVHRVLNTIQQHEGTDVYVSGYILCNDPSGLTDGVVWKLTSLTGSGSRRFSKLTGLTILTNSDMSSTPTIQAIGLVVDGISNTTVSDYRSFGMGLGGLVAGTTGYENTFNRVNCLLNNWTDPSVEGILISGHDLMLNNIVTVCYPIGVSITGDANDVSIGHSWGLSLGALNENYGKQCLIPLKISGYTNNVISFYSDTPETLNYGDSPSLSNGGYGLVFDGGSRNNVEGYKLFVPVAAPNNIKVMRIKDAINNNITNTQIINGTSGLNSEYVEYDGGFAGYSKNNISGGDTHNMLNKFTYSSTLSGSTTPGSISQTGLYTFRKYDRLMTVHYSGTVSSVSVQPTGDVIIPLPAKFNINDETISTLNAVMSAISLPSTNASSPVNAVYVSTYNSTMFRYTRTDTGGNSYLNASAIKAGSISFTYTVNLNRV